MTPNDTPRQEVSSISLGASNAVVELRVADEVLAAALRRATRGLRTTGGSAEVLIDVTPVRGGWLVESPHCGSRRFDHAGAVRDWVEWAACESLLALLRAHVAVHAAGALIGEKAVLALGPSGAGKSALAAAWCQAGRSLYGDDGVLVNSGGGVEAFRRLGKVDRALAQATSIAPELTPFWDEGHDEVWLDPEGVSGPGWAPPRPAGILAWVRWQQGAPVRIDRVAPGEMVARAMGQVLGGSLTTAFEGLSAAVRTAETVMVTFGVAGDAVEALEAL